uniref:Uncharacterized protein n=1 Tax=Sphaerodactylus townsendi TaxID=933632 RepID=A0ACB8G8B4_9SAUR
MSSVAGKGPSFYMPRFPSDPRTQPRLAQGTYDGAVCEQREGVDLSQAVAKPGYLCRQVYLDSLAQPLPSETGAFRSRQLKMQKRPGKIVKQNTKLERRDLSLGVCWEWLPTSSGIWQQYKSVANGLNHKQCSPAKVLEPRQKVTAVLGKDVMLPCSYQATAGEKVFQVTWLKRGDDGQTVELAALNSEHGEYIQEAYAGRVSWQSQESLKNGSIVLRNAVQADEGNYECHLITFPQGNFESHLTLKVLVPPLPTLNPGPPLEEGQGRTLAASCTAEGNPVPNVTWETEVTGKTDIRHSSHPRSASVTIEYYVVPGRNMHGKLLTCVVSHPGLQHQKRITHRLNVSYLSDASVLGHETEEDWVTGEEGVSLKCLGDGNPPPTYNWTSTGAETRSQGNVRPSVPFPDSPAPDLDYCALQSVKTSLCML